MACSALRRAGIFAASLCCGMAAAAANPASSQPPQTVPEQAGSGSSVSSLSQQLDRSGGIIHPPADVDSGMAQPPPPAGSHSMPIVPPPGAPGGNPDIKPK